MSQNKYAEPWRTFRYDAETATGIKDSNDETVAIALTVYPECVIGLGEEQASRAVACVNELAGLEFESGAVRKLIFQARIAYRMFCLSTPDQIEALGDALFALNIPEDWKP